ncbi:thioredoxin domain-containing protein [Frankia sp. Cj5]|uniref:DsbA family protein n=1 Tax=Frankia sp. Cj5 TaxID=2880978 RepID=UPI001EF4EF70|nr:thioredoxin domain-containing protein [Frankia sp. Cj5]
MSATSDKGRQKDAPAGRRPAGREEARREKAAAARAAEIARARRRQRTIIAFTVVAVLALVGVIGFVIQNSRAVSTPVVVPANATGSDNGIVVGKAAAAVTVDFYEDFQCPVCENLETSLGGTIQQMIDSGKIRAVYHMMSFIGPESVRAANAGAAAAQENKFKEYHDILYANQPRERTGGFTNATLIGLGDKVGLTSTAFTDAVNNGTYKGYVAKVEDDASKRGVTGTPTVFVNGSELAAQALTPQGFTDAVAAAGGGGSGGNATPTG